MDEKLEKHDAPNNQEDRKTTLEILNSSSARNRTALYSFLSLLVYMLITVGSVTDLMLLIPDSNVTLPLFNVDISLFAFFILAPVFLLALHFSVLYGLTQHAALQLKWRVPEDPCKDCHLVHPFFANFNIRFAPRQVSWHLARAVIVLSVIVFPLALMILIQCTFSKYQSVLMTGWHVICSLASVALVVFYGDKIISLDMHTEEAEKPKWFWGRLKELLAVYEPGTSPWHWLVFIVRMAFFFGIGIFLPILGVVWSVNRFHHDFYMPIWLILILIIGLWGGSLAYPIRIKKPQGRLMKMAQAIAGPALCLGLLGLLWQFICWLLGRLTRLLSGWYISLIEGGNGIEKANKKNLDLKEEHKKLNILLGLIGFFIGMICLNAVLMGATWFGHIDLIKDNRLLFPHLTVRNQLLVAKDAPDEIKAAYIRARAPKDKNENASYEPEYPPPWLGQMRTLSLDNRRLHLADLSDSLLYKAELRKSHLQGANLSGAHLEQADLEEAHLEGSVLEGAHLKGSNLEGAWLEDAYLRDAHLECSVLWDVHFEGANLFSAHLEGTHLEMANLVDTELDFAHFEGANLWSAQLQGISVIGVNFQGADLSEVRGQGAFLRCVCLQGANFSGAQLQGIDLQYQDLEGVNLRRAHLEGAHMQNVRLENAFVDGMFIYGGDWQDSSMGDIMGYPNVSSSDDINEWDEWTIYWLNQTPLSAHKAMKKRLDEAKERIEDFKAQEADNKAKLESLFKQHQASNLESFLEERMKLACKNKYVVIGLLNQYYARSHEKEYEKAIKQLLEYTKQCPDPAIHKALVAEYKQLQREKF
ncbi:pentapeptide repeat-containing protein [Desulfatibacillum aliphaticivorans]|uniref:pentapeptide repeat-containing protein n=1 Tax=Desulfatibacillum aliphaticivorans TaxID=218208 RepID=UPI00041549C7|nr:pentapeptide repeat-containing protein [Desulfatibacillum aliphaticivorans]